VNTSRKLKPREAEVLRALGRWYRENGYPPSVRELCEAVGLASTRSVHDYLNRLEELGYIRRHRDRSRAIEILRDIGESEDSSRVGADITRDRVKVPIIGEVAAGSPIYADQRHDGEMVLDASLITHPQCYLLRVRGDSMIDAHVCNGDLILVQPQPEARNGDIVVVLIEHDVTLKRFFKHEGYVELVPENPHMASIILTPDMGDIRVLGKLAGVIRRC
jgi:repressor LexA